MAQVQGSKQVDPRSLSPARWETNRGGFPAMDFPES